MTSERIKALLAYYAEGLRVFKAEPADAAVTGCGEGIAAKVVIWRHLKWMCLEGIKIANDKERGDASALGFVQGALWALGVYSIDELREHNESALPTGVSAPRDTKGA